MNPVASEDAADVAAVAAPIALAELPALPVAGKPIVAHAHPLHALKIHVRVSVGELQMTVADLLAARANQVFVLDRTLEQPVDLVVEGRTVARGQLVAVDGSFAVRVTELPTPMKT